MNRGEALPLLKKSANEFNVAKRGVVQTCQS